MNGTTGRHRLPRWLAFCIIGFFVIVGLALLVELVVGLEPLARGSPSLTNLLSNRWDPLSGRYGLVPFLVGTALVSALALAVAIPLGLGVAVTAARQVSERRMMPLVRVLAAASAIPSVIFGWWGLLMVVPAVRTLFGGSGFSLLAAGLVLAVMLVPTLSLLFYQALVSVPQSYHDASDALGATPDQTLLRLTFPCAAPSLVRAVLIAVARAVGETMAVQMVIGGRVLLPAEITSSGATLTSQLLTHLTVFAPNSQGRAVIDLIAVILMAAMYLLVRASDRWGPQS